MNSLLERANELLERYGFELRLGAELLGILVGCVVAYVVARQIIIRVVERLVRRTPTDWDDVLLDKGVFRRLAWVAPALVVFYSTYRLESAELQEILQRFVVIYIILLVVLVVSRTLSAINAIYRKTERAKHFPIKGYIQVAQIIVAIIGIIVLVSTVLDQSPWGILSGLGAATAILLLVFRDTILSFVASVQLTTNDIVRVGDWISMPQYGADGDIVDIALYTVKVQNWDKTITTIPTSKLMQESVKNWRGMAESGGRRIARAVIIDMRSIRFLEEADLASLGRVALLREYLPAKLEEVKAWNEEHQVDPQSPINGRRLTNIGTLRAYLSAYLRAHPMIHQDMTFLVRQLEPTAEGLPLQIYVFSKDQRWPDYEAIQADIFDHILAALPVFDLRVFQRPTGHDFSVLRVSE